MKKIACIFPGQGAQYVGMAADYIAGNARLKAVMKAFDQAHRTSLQSIMLQGPEEALKETRFTQPAILFHSAAAYAALQDAIDFEPAFVAGHSLGEFSALVANGTLTLPDAMHLVHKRGEFMMNANGDTPFGMAAIVGLTPQAVKEICVQAQDAGIVIAANFNTPVQTVISGSLAGVTKASELAKAAGAKRVIPLTVGGPFHSPLVQKAGTWLREEMENINFATPTIPVVQNVHAKPETDPKTIKENLVKQVTSSVLWVDTMEFMLAQGIELFIEFGPNRVLAGMMKKIDRKAKVLSIDTPADVVAVKEYLEQNNG